MNQESRKIKSSLLYPGTAKISLRMEARTNNEQSEIDWNTNQKQPKATNSKQQELAKNEQK